MKRREPPTNELPSVELLPARASEPTCEKCGVGGDPWRGAVKRYWCGGRMRMLHWACHDVLELEMAGKL
jgi:hypothetical protein